MSPQLGALAGWRATTERPGPLPNKALAPLRYGCVTMQKDLLFQANLTFKKNVNGLKHNKRTLFIGLMVVCMD